MKKEWVSVMSDKISGTPPTPPTPPELPSYSTPPKQTNTSSSDPFEDSLDTFAQLPETLNVLTFPPS
ncbi:MAG: hypothetical protein HYZ47_03920 [Simkania negevensis]|nr:hypothetical protein [Simkania negevensis]